MKTYAFTAAALLLMAGWATAAPAAQTAPLSGGAPATLSTIVRPPTLIASANVLDASGQVIGAVQRVDVTPDGVPTKVAVALIGKDERMVVLDADAVQYDPAKNEIRASASRDQILAKSG
jgi:hypothetical protein